MKIIRQYIQEVDIQAFVDVDDAWVAEFTADYLAEAGEEPSAWDLYDAALETDDRFVEIIEIQEPGNSRAAETWIEEQT